MNDKIRKAAPEEGPDGVDRWTSNGYGLVIDGIKVKSPTEKEDKHGNETPKPSAHER